MNFIKENKRKMDIVVDVKNVIISQKMIGLKEIQKKEDLMKENEFHVWKRKEFLIV